MDGAELDLPLLTGLRVAQLRVVTRIHNATAHLNREAWNNQRTDVSANGQIRV